jgi:hypothetical protein
MHGSRSRCCPSARSTGSRSSDGPTRFECRSPPTAATTPRCRASRIGSSCARWRRSARRWSRRR